MIPLSLFSCPRSLLLAVFLFFGSTEATVCQRDFLNLSRRQPKPEEKTEGAERLTKPTSLGWVETCCILPFFFLSRPLWLQSPAEDPRFKDSDPSVSPIPTFMSPSSPQPSHSAFIKAGRESINSGAQLMAVCPSVAVNSVLDIRNMSPLNSRCLKPVTPDSDGCSRPPLSDPCDTCAVSWKTLAQGEGGRGQTGWFAKFLQTKLSPAVAIWSHAEDL